MGRGVAGRGAVGVVVAASGAVTGAPGAVEWCGEEAARVVRHSRQAHGVSETEFEVEGGVC